MTDEGAYTIKAMQKIEHTGRFIAEWIRQFQVCTRPDKPFFIIFIASNQRKTTSRLSLPSERMSGRGRGGVYRVLYRLLSRISWFSPSF